MCLQNVDLLNVKLAVHITTTGPSKVDSKNMTRPMAEHATCKTEANGRNSRYSKVHLLSNALELIHGESQQTHTSEKFTRPKNRNDRGNKNYELQFHVQKLGIATGLVDNTVNSCKVFVAESDSNLTAPVCAGSLLTAWGKVMLRIVSNMIHTNTIPEHYTCVYYWQ